MYGRHHISGFLLGVFLGMAAAPPSAWAEPQRDRIGNDAPVLASVDSLYALCLAQCAETSVYRMELESCERACADLRRNFPFLDEGYSSYDRCARDMDTLDLNRDVLARRAAKECARASSHIHKRQGCRNAVDFFYKNASTEQICLRRPFAAGSGPVPLAPPASAPVSPASPQPAPSSAAGAALPPDLSPPAGQKTASAKAASAAAPILVSGPLLQDTPKYQTPEEVAKTRRRSKGKSPAAAPGSRAAGKSLPSAQGGTPPAQETRAAQSAPAANREAVPPAISTAKPPEGAKSSRPISVPAAPLPPAAAPAPPGPEVSPARPPAQDSVTRPETAAAPLPAAPLPPVTDAPAPPGPEVSPARPPAASLSGPLSPPSAAPAVSPQPEQPPSPAESPSPAPPANSPRMPLSRLLQIPPSQEPSPQEADSATTLLPPTPSMLKQHDPTPPTLRPGLQ
ncbi:MAG: hypothetical protein LBP61_05300 [Desulfovibrio sp.]|jgi:hypothetical protein|nr:hypothetical protein [Desulfovibrio sp.]